MEQIVFEIHLMFKKKQGKKTIFLEDVKQYEFKEKDSFDFLETIRFILDLQEKDATELIETGNLRGFEPYSRNLNLSIGEKIFYLNCDDLGKIEQREKLSESILTSAIKSF